MYLGGEFPDQKALTMPYIQTFNSGNTPIPLLPEVEAIGNAQISLGMISEMMSAMIPETKTCS